MNDLSRITRPLLALSLAAAALSTAACAKDAKTAEPHKHSAAPGARVVNISITDEGYRPSPVTLKQGEPVKLVLTRTTDHTCATEIVLDEHGINTPLPLNQPVEVHFTPTKTGKLVYGCAMGKMISGVLMVE
jgi:plastocyanin domain-containing protein